MRKIKNYFIITFIFVVSIILIIYLTKWYNTIQTYNTNKTIMRTIISEVKTEDLTNYIIENQNTVLYITNGSNETIKSFEKELKKIIEKEGIRKEFIFIDNNNAVSLNDVLHENLSEGLKLKNINLNIVPNMLIIRDGKIVDILYKTDMTINKLDVVNFLIEYGVIE